jgi:hypothetical protein
MKLLQISAPCVQHSKETDFSVFQITRLRCARAQHLNARIEDGVKASFAMLANHVPHFLWHRTGDKKMMNGQQTFGLFLQPLLSLFVLTIRTVPIAARSSDPVLATTIVALIHDRSQFARATARENTQHSSHLNGRGISIVLKKRGNMLPKTFGNRGHGIMTTVE